MGLSDTCPGENCATVGIDAVPLGAFAAVETGDGEMIIYDQENEDAWIQSDRHYPRNRIG